MSNTISSSQATQSTVGSMTAAPDATQPHIAQAENAFTTVQTALTGNQVSLTNNNTIAPERKVDSTLKSESFDYRVKIDPTQTILNLPNDPNTYEIDKLISIAKNYLFSREHILVHLNNNAYSNNDIVKFLSSIKMDHLTPNELKAVKDFLLDRVKINTQTILSLPNDPNIYEIDKLKSIAKNYPFSWKHIFVHLNNNAYSANNIVEFLSSIEINHLTDKELKAAEDLKKKLESNPSLAQATQKTLTDINNNLKSAKTRNIITRMFQFFNKKLINKIIDKVTTDDSWGNALINHSYLSNKFIESLNVNLLQELKKKSFDQWCDVSYILVNMTGKNNRDEIHLSKANLEKLQKFSKYNEILYEDFNRFKSVEELKKIHQSEIDPQMH